MKNILIAIALLVQANAMAQYRFSSVLAPEIKLEVGKKIWVEYFTNNKPEQWNLNTDYKLKSALEAQIVQRNRKSDFVGLAPWIHTCWFELAQGPEDADYIIAGDFTINTSQQSKVSEHMFTEQEQKKNPLHYVVRKYEYAASFSMDVNLVLTDKAGKVIYQDAANYAKQIAPPPSWGVPHEEKDFFTCRTEAVQSICTKFADKFLPELKVMKIYLLNIEKTKENKERLEKIREHLANGRKLEAAQAYAQWAENAEAAYNAGVLYLILGNFKRAKVNFDRANKSNKAEIEAYMQETQAIFAAAGLPTR